MKKQKAIDLLQLQIKNIQNPQITRKEWITTTTAVVQRIFPVSSLPKIKQIEDLESNPDYFEDLSAENRIKTRKSKAESYLNNYIEEIELLGVESHGDKMQMFFGSIRFWLILLAICVISFIGGNSAAKTEEAFRQFNPDLLQDLERQLDDQKRVNDSLKKELLAIKTLG